MAKRKEMPHFSKSGYVWIELPKVDNVEAAQIHCDLVNAMLSKLVGYDIATKEHSCFFATDDQHYVTTYYNFGNPVDGSHEELEDRGRAFDLD